MVLKYPRTNRPCSFAAGTISAKCSSDCATVLLVFLRLCDSVADMNTATSRIPAATARSRPARLGTRAVYRTPGFRATRCATSSVSASCGIQSGRTKDPSSMRCSPASANASTRRSRASTDNSADSFCRPSRGPTSYKVTRPGIIGSASRADVVPHPFRDRARGGAGREDLLHSQLLQLGNVGIGTDPAVEYHHVVRALLA